MRCDDVADVLGRADPARGVRDERSSAEIADAVQRIVDARSRPVVAASSRRWPWIAVPSAAVLVTLALVAVQLINPVAPTRAVTPPLLTFSPTSQPIGAIVDRAVARLDSLAIDQPSRGASYEGWYLESTVGAGGSSTISPQRHLLTWRSDLSGELTVTAGHPFGGAGDPPTDGPEPGTVLVSERYAAGEAPIVFTTPPPADPGELRAYLARATGSEAADAVGILSAARILLSEWRLSGSEQAALLRVLESSRGLDVAGDVTDRLGRPATALRATSPDDPAFEYLAIIGHDSGAVIAIETIYVGGLSELDVVAPSVVDYIAWT